MRAPILVTDAVTELMTLAEAKDHLRIDSTNTADDSLLNFILPAVRHQIQNITGRALIESTWGLYLDEFPPACDYERFRLREEQFAPTSGIIRINRTPLISIESIKYYDNNDAQQTLASTEYQTSNKGMRARVAPAYGKTWPATRTKFDAVEILFKAGYGTTAATVPAPIRNAARLLLGAFYEQREAIVQSAIPMAEVPAPMSVYYLLAPYKVVAV